MGVELVEGRDLVVDDHRVYSRTIEGLVRVDVIYRRIDDDFLDPVSFSPDSALGVPGLLGALRAGNVSVCNAIGNGVVDDKGVYPYVPDLIRYYLGAEPIIDNVTTYMMWDPDQRAEALGRLDELVAKPVGESGGSGVLIGPHASEQETRGDSVRNRGRAPPVDRSRASATLYAARLRRRSSRVPASGPAPLRPYRRDHRGVSRVVSPVWPCDAAEVVISKQADGRGGQFVSGSSGPLTVPIAAQAENQHQQGAQQQ